MTDADYAVGSDHCQLSHGCDGSVLHKQFQKSLPHQQVELRHALTVTLRPSSSHEPMTAFVFTSLTLRYLKAWHPADNSTRTCLSRWLDCAPVPVSSDRIVLRTWLIQQSPLYLSYRVNKFERDFGVNEF